MMRWVLVATVAAMAMGSAAMADLPVASRTSSVLACPLVPVAPTVDGKLDDAAYRRAQPLKINAYLNKHSVNFTTEAWLCRDTKNIYLAVRCFDDRLDALVTKNTGSMMWQNDCVEVMIVPEKKERFYSKFIIDCLGRTVVGTWVPDEWGEATAGPEVPLVVKTGRETGDVKAWTLEVAIPIKAFGIEITEKSVWAFGLNREKYTLPKEISSYQGGFNKPAQYPDLVFDGRPLVFDGLGIRNIGTSRQGGIMQVAVPADGAANVRSLPFNLAPGESASVPANITRGVKEGTELQFQVISEAGGAKPMAETYVVVAPPKAFEMPDPSEVATEVQFAPSPFDDPAFFPIMVWLQPAAGNTVAEYKALGVNVFMGGMTSYPNPKGKAWLDAIAAEGLYAIIEYSDSVIEEGLHKHPAVVGWHHMDEPDLMNKDQTGPVATPEEVMASFVRLRSIRPAHRIFLNLSQTVSYERFVGKAVPDAFYPKYVQACDVVQYDIYPLNSFPDGAERLHLVAKGMDRLMKWTEGKKLLGFAIETNKFTKPSVKQSRAPTVEEFETQAWMAIVHGARYLNLFCHSWSKELNPKKGLEAKGIYPHIKAALPRVTGEIKSLAPAINSPTIEGKVTVATALGSRVDVLVKAHDGALYVFAVNMFAKPEKATFTVKGLDGAKVEVLFEDRELELRGGKFVDAFKPYAVHRYKIVK